MPSQDAESVDLELSDLIWGSPDHSAAEKVRLSFSIYRDMPTTMTLNLVWLHWPRPPAEADAEASALLWSEMRALLGDEDDRLARPVEYVLWADWFNSLLDDAAWTQIAEVGSVTDRGYERLLTASGPAPYARKRVLYRRLPERRWDPWVLYSLCFSCVDFFGQVDAAAALEDLDRFRKSDLTTQVEALRNFLRRATTDRTVWRRDVDEPAFARLLDALREPWGPFRD